MLEFLEEVWLVECRRLTMVNNALAISCLLIVCYVFEDASCLSVYLLFNIFNTFSTLFFFLFIYFLFFYISTRLLLFLLLNVFFILSPWIYFWRCITFRTLFRYPLFSFGLLFYFLTVYHLNLIKLLKKFCHKYLLQNKSYFIFGRYIWYEINIIEYYILNFLYKNY